jgi:CYTH domain-containing protein/predicted ATPase
MAKEKNKEEPTEEEFERRWLVRDIDPSTRRSPSLFIEQAYLDRTRDLRVRIVDGKEAILARKTGRGRARIEKPKRAPLDVGRFLAESTPYVIRKRRYLRDGWEVDYFEGPLSGLIIAEREKKSLAALAKVKLPPWIRDAVEVTDTITNRLLARIAYDLTCEGTTDRPIHEYLPKKVRSIVLTGGPCSGKSTLMDLFREEHGAVLHCVPETATIVIDSVGVKPPVGDPIGMRAFQRTIYRIQHSFEKASHSQAFKDGKAALLLDRGTVDGAAYMAKGTDDLALICETTLDEEYARYDGVICLDVPPKDVYDAHKHENPARTETHAQAVALGDRILSAWGDHPKFRYVRGRTLEEKIAAARAALREIAGVR